MYRMMCYNHAFSLQLVLTGLLLEALVWPRVITLALSNILQKVLMTLSTLLCLVGAYSQYLGKQRTGQVNVGWGSHIVHFHPRRIWLQSTAWVIRRLPGGWVGFRMHNRLLEDLRGKVLKWKLPAHGRPFHGLEGSHSLEGYKIFQVAQGICEVERANVTEDTVFNPFLTPRNHYVRGPQPYEI